MMTKKDAFTLTELLLVLAIVFVLFSLAFPAFKNVREISRSSVCVSNLRQIGIGLFAYSGDNSGFFPTADLSHHTSTMLPQTNRWPYIAWNYMGLGNPKNGGYVKGVNDTSYGMKKPNIFVCPTSRITVKGYPGAWQTRQGGACYGMSVNPAQFFYSTTNWSEAPNFPVNRAWVRNSAGTALILEAQYLVVGSSLYTDRVGLIPHHGGMNVLYYDGHVEWIAANDIPTHYMARPFWRAN